MAVLVMAAIGLGACSKPTDAELRGTWVDTGKQATLRLNPDGTARLIDWPLSKIFDLDDERRVSARGRWNTADSMSAGDDLWSLDLDVDRIDDGTSPVRGTRNEVTFGWCGWQRCILAVRGDPDTGDELVFFKSADAR